MRGTDGTLTMPAPSRPRLPPVEPERPVRTERPLREAPLRTVEPGPPACPLSRAVVAMADAGAGALPQVSQYPSEIVPPQPGSAQRSEEGTAAGSDEAAEPPDAAAGLEAAGLALGAVPQTRQYPSSMVPVQPGSVQFMIASPISA
ncbi:hypothetical protein ACFXHA_38670 [Nocardia sp. NPDC059240]|uniref:hypothetical protein n=1 Tax=Nocardia sp. NPDC059240 TaxID=3346786 RepID=UPI0036B47127